MVSSTARPAAQASGLPPNVEPCWPGASRCGRLRAEGRPGRRSARRRPGPWPASSRRARPRPAGRRTTCRCGRCRSAPRRGRAARRARGSARGRRAGMPVPGLSTPASPWMGSRTTAAVPLGDGGPQGVASSPYGTWRHARDERLERLAVGGLVGQRQGTGGAAVEGALGGDDAGAAGAAGQLDRGLDRLGAGVGEEDRRSPSGAPASASSRSASATCGSEVKKLETWIGLAGLLADRR